MSIRCYLGAVGFLLLCPAMVSAMPEEVPVVRIEEDWEMVVLQPDEQVDAPQVVTTMLPFGEESDLLFQVDINHGSAPTFETGGLQVRINDDDLNLSEKRICSGDTLVYDQEKVSWTQVIAKKQNSFTFEIKDGSSESFGSFGGEPTRVSISHSDSGEESLNNYSHENSLENSGITYASNRVDYIRLKSVRVYYADGAMANVNVNQELE